MNLSPIRSKEITNIWSGMINEDVRIDDYQAYNFM